MDRLEALERRLGEVMKTVKTIAEELKELKQEAQQGKPASLKLHKTAFKVKESRYNNGSKIVIVEKGKDSIAFALNKEDWLKLREFLDSYFGTGNSKKSYNGKSYNKKSYSKKSYGKKKRAKPVEVEEVEGYENALDEE